jgi:hypothetical protein
LAKVYLYQKKWQLAVDECDKVTGYSLTPNFRIFIKFPEKIMQNLYLKLMEAEELQEELFSNTARYREQEVLQVGAGDLQLQLKGYMMLIQQRIQEGMLPLFIEI